MECSKLRDYLNLKVSSLGYVLCECRLEHNSLKVYISHEERLVNLRDCEKVHTSLLSWLPTIDSGLPRYMAMEVSSVAG